MNKRSLNILVCVLVAVIFIVHECLRVILPDVLIIRAVLKIIIGMVPIAILHVNCDIKKYKWQLAVFIGIILYCIADAVMTYSDGIGMGFFAIGHIFVLIGFISERRPNRVPLVAWIVVSIILNSMCIFAGPELGFGRRFLMFAGIYLTFVAAMTAESYCMNRGILVGALIFFVSDMLIIYNMIFGETVVRHFFSLGLYYLGIYLFAIYIRKYIHDNGQQAVK